MNAYRPEADTEYSRAPGASEGAGRRRRGRRGGTSGHAEWGTPPSITAATVLGAALLIVAEFTTLIKVHSGAYDAGIIRTISAGSHHSYALIPIALLAVALAVAARTAAYRPALAGIGVLGLVALGIALLGDLPDVHASGLIRQPSGAYVTAASSAGIALYLETLGAIVLLIAAGAGLITAPGSGPGGSLRERLRRR